MSKHITEAQFQRQIIELAHLLGYCTYHTYDSRRSEPGFPDLVLVHPMGDLLIAELKTDKGRVSPAQTLWIALLRGAGAEVHVWRPRDWERIVERLTRHRLRVSDKGA